MKKILSVILTLCMIMACMFTVVACNNDNNNQSGNNSENGSSSEPDSTSGNSDSENSESSSSSSSSSSQNTWNSTKSTDREPYEWTPATDLVLGSNDGTEAVTLYLVGDSTVCDYNNEPTRYYPRNGYGMWFSEYLNENVNVVNLALSGRSSKSFLTEKNYKTLTDNIKAGDYLVIGFGHNDEKKEAARYTNPNSAVIYDDSFKYCLYEYYIKPAVEAGATPILCTPIVRHDAKNAYTGEKVHVTSGDGANGYEGGDYTKAIIELGQEKGITVIDLTAVTKQIMMDAGAENAKLYYASAAGDASKPLNHNSIDSTHINAYGAATVAYNFMLEILKTDNTLKLYINNDKMVAPTSDVLVPNLGNVEAQA